MKRQRPQRDRKLTISFTLMGDALTTIELTLLEYEQIRRLPLAEAVGLIIQKDPRMADHRQVADLIGQQIAAGNFRLSERREKP